MKLSSCTLALGLLLGAVSSTPAQDGPTPSPLAYCGAEAVSSTPNSSIYRITLPCTVTVTAANAAQLVGEDLAEDWGCYFPKTCTDQGKLCSGPDGTGSAASVIILGPFPIPTTEDCGWELHFTDLETTVECPCVDDD